MRYAVTAALMLSGLALAGCDESLATLAGPTRDLEPTFSSVQRLILEAGDSSGRVGCTSCHSAAGSARAGRLNLSADAAYAALVGVPSTGKRGATRVIPGDPDNSYLVHKLEGGPDIVGARMPNTGGPYLTEGQMAILKRWIARGAPND
jgi:hypothetical protein